MASFNDSHKPESAHPADLSPISQPSKADFRTTQELRVSEIVLAAAVLEPDEREDFLRRLTVEEPGLLDEAKRRLRQAAELPSAFLAVPAAELLQTAEQVADTPGDAPPPRISGTSDRYRLAECIGRGGMARVFKAFDRQLHRPVAIKLLERADPRTLRRFLREAQAQARVRHEYVLDVYETGEIGGQPYIAMRYVDGPTLMEIREETSLEQKVRLMAQVAEGLHAAHREGLLHRDVKPSNILVEATSSGKLRPWVTDFGIATRIGGGSSVWSIVHAGTPYYLAPERMSETQTFDRRSDIYSLGVTLYQFFSGELPFDDQSLGEMLRQVREDAPIPLLSRVPGLPVELEAIVMKCLAKEPSERYDSARAVADDLWRFLDGEAVQAHASTLKYRLTQRAGRHEAFKAVGLVAIVLVVALLATLIFSTIARARRATHQAISALDDVATLHHEEGRYKDAEEIYRKTVDLRTAYLGSDHPDLAHVLGNLAILRIEQSDFEMAGLLIQQARDVLEKSTDVDDWRRARVEGIFASQLTKLGRFEEAEELLLAAYRPIHEQTGVGSAATRQALDQIVDLYEEWGRENEAAKYRDLRP